MFLSNDDKSQIREQCGKVALDKITEFVDYVNGGGSIFIVEPNVTTFEDVLAAYNAGKTLISMKTEVWRDISGEIIATEYFFGNLNCVSKGESGYIENFEFSCTSSLWIHRYRVNADDGWIENSDRFYGFTAWYNDTTFDEVMEAYDAEVPIELREDIGGEDTEKEHRAPMTSYVYDSANETGYFEFMHTEIEDDKIITTRYRLNNNDEYTKTVWKTDATLVNT